MKNGTTDWLLKKLGDRGESFYLYENVLYEKKCDLGLLMIYWNGVYFNVSQNLGRVLW